MVELKEELEKGLDNCVKAINEKRGRLDRLLGREYQHTHNEGHGLYEIRRNGVQVAAVQLVDGELGGYVVGGKALDPVRKYLRFFSSEHKLKVHSFLEGKLV